MKKKILLTVVFGISLLPACMSQYGGCRGVQEVSGILNLLNPIGIVSVVAFFAGVWVPFENNKINTCIDATGVVGMVVAELYTFMTWHVQTITGEISIQNSIRLAYSEFYIGLCVSLLMVIAYFVINNRVKE